MSKLTIEDAQEIATELGITGDIAGDVAQANEYSGGSYSKAESLFRGYMEEYAADKRSEERFCEFVSYDER